MLKKEHRLTKKKDFDNVFAVGRSSFSDILGIKLVANNTEKSRIGFLVGSKVSKKAVVRNLIKRRLRAAISSFLFSLPSGFDIVIIANKKIIEYNFSDIKKVLEINLKKLTLKRKDVQTSTKIVSG